MNWRPGDIAIIKDGGGPCRYPELFGTECQLLEYLGDWSSLNGTVKKGWNVDIDGNPEFIVAERCLHPLPPHDEIGSWDDCVFKPRELAT